MRGEAPHARHREVRVRAAQRAEEIEHGRGAVPACAGQRDFAYRRDRCGVRAGGETLEARKAFHVSPFLPMDRRYHWALQPPDESIRVHMDVLRGEARELLAQYRRALADAYQTQLAR